MCHTPAIRCLLPSTYTGLKAFIDRSGRTGGNKQGFVERTVMPPGIQPGVADHAPSQGQVVAGEGPVRSTGFSRVLPPGLGS